MTDPGTYTSEHRSWQWDLVLQYEEGSLPPAMWNANTLAVVSDWYAKNLAADQAKARYGKHYERNRHRMTNRLDKTLVDSGAIDAVDAVWESLLTNALAARETEKG